MEVPGSNHNNPRQGGHAPRGSLPFTPDSIPAELKARPQWVCWRLVPDPDKPKPAKVPFDPKTGKAASASDPSTWGTFEQAVERLARDSTLAGIGYELGQGDPYTGIDLDKCRDPETGELRPVLLEVDRATGEVKRSIDPQKIIDDMASYTEVSPSGTGLRIFVKATLPREGRKKLAFECYSEARFLTITGQHLPGTPTTVEARQQAMDALHRRVFPPKANGQAKPAGNGQARPEMSLTDQELIEKASSNPKKGARFAALWSGDTSGNGNDHSAADQALCNLLAFWTNGDAERIDRLFRQSGLYREKWDKRHHSDGRTYGQATINKALAGMKDGYTGPRSGNGKAKSTGGGDAHHVHGNGQDGPTKAAEPDSGDTWPRLSDEDKPLHRTTDLSNAWRLATHHGKDLLHVTGAGWHTWTGTHWKRSDKGALCVASRVSRLVAIEVVEVTKQLANTEAEDKRKELSGIADGLLSWRKQSESRSRIEAALSLAGSFLDIDVTTLDKGKWLLNCQNGTLDLRTRKLRPHRRSDFITRCVPVAYDPSATCPTWEAFLNRIFDNKPSLVRFQQKALGYSLTGDTREKCIFILYGPKGDNGKSTLLQAISTLLARYATEAAPELLMARKSERHPTEIADLHGARLVTALETGKRRSLNENLVKQMTGCGDKLKGRYMRENFFEFYPEFKLFLATNHKPVIRGTDNAIWNRIRLIPFEVSIPKAEQDKNLPAKLQAELPGILNWAVEGCRLWLAEGMEPPEEVENATTGYREEMDVLAGFLADHCFIGEKATASAKDLYETYCKWCETNGEVPETQRSFGMSLTERGFERYRNNGMNWKGIGLKGEVF